MAIAATRPSRASAPRKSESPRPRLRVNAKYVYGVGAVVAVLVLWQIVAALRIKPAIILPGPTDVIAAFRQLFASATIWTDLATSGKELLYGLVLATLVGLPLGLLIGWYRKLSYAASPLINFLYATPRIALTPLLIIWLGFGLTSKVVIAALVAFFPILVNVIVGLKTVDGPKLDLMRSLDASRWQTFRYVTFPNALPFVFAGLDIAVVFSVLGAIVGEFVGSQRGLGNLILQFHTSLDMAGMFAVLLLLAALGVGLHLAIQAIQRRVIFWAQADHVVGA